MSGKRGRRGRENIKMGIRQFRVKEMLFLLFLFGYERKWKEKTEGEENMSYGWVKQGLKIYSE